MPSHRRTSHRLGPSAIKKLAAGSGTILAVVALVLVSLGLAGHKAPDTPHTRKAANHPPVAVGRCPLTDLPAPGGTVPRRPALAVKIGNEPGTDPAAGNGARPQSGLNEADIVFDTPAEGGIMRYEAVYQCQQPPSIGPVRSLRWVDWHVLGMFGNGPLLAFAGGIKPDLDALASQGWAKSFNLLGNQAALGERVAGRAPPDNLYTNSARIWASVPHERKPPAPVFRYSAALPSLAKPASQLQINFSAGTDVVWKWQPTTNSWLHTYAGAVDVDAATGKPVTTTNIVVQIVHYTLGPYIESAGGTGDVESRTIGSGPGYVLRNGKQVAVVWHRPTLTSGLTFTDASGQQVGLAPGRTWVEIVLQPIVHQAGGLTITP